MDRKYIGITVLVVLTAFLTGLGLAYINSPDSGQCDGIAEAWENNQTIDATMSCYPPGVLDAEPSDTVSENTDQQCFCRAVANGEIKIISISVASFQP